ncbi:hypothetical protein [Clostridium transplantifaecale]|uniref:hypothetical protein n=1 Tax=Clostridium transplantifaecale TaxID=2479838 RepID=UPI000F631E47|nr:hypothetical protein [Clostridium transplantifaecale]
MYSNERERFPQELFLPVFPAHDTLTPGTKDSSIPLTTPAPGLTAASSFLNSTPICARTVTKPGKVRQREWKNTCYPNSLVIE